MDEQEKQARIKASQAKEKDEKERLKKEKLDQERLEREAKDKQLNLAQQQAQDELDALLDQTRYNPVVDKKESNKPLNINIPPSADSQEGEFVKSSRSPSSGRSKSGRLDRKPSVKGDPEADKTARHKSPRTPKAEQSDKLEDKKKQSSKLVQSGSALTRSGKAKQSLEQGASPPEPQTIEQILSSQPSLSVLEEILAEDQKLNQLMEQDVPAPVVEDSAALQNSLNEAAALNFDSLLGGLDGLMNL